MRPTILPGFPRRPVPGMLRFLILTGLTLCLVAFQPPPSNGSGSGTVVVQVVFTTGTPARGVTVQYLDEWHRQSYAECTTDPTGTCRLPIENAPALGNMVRGVVSVGGSVQDAMVLDGETSTVHLVLDAHGTLTHGADVLATRDPNATPTMLSVEDALATLTAAASEPLATPSPGIERTVAAAHGAMTATSVARTSLTPTPRVTPTVSATPNVGVVVIVNNTPAPIPQASTPNEESPSAGVRLTELTQAGARLTVLLLVSSLVLLGGGAWWIRRRTGGAK